MTKTAAQLDAEILAFVTSPLPRRRPPAGYAGGYADASGQYSPALYEAAQRAAGARESARRTKKDRARMLRAAKAGKLRGTDLGSSDREKFTAWLEAHPPSPSLARIPPAKLAQMQEWNHKR